MMKKLTPKSVEKYAKKLFIKIKDKEMRDYRLVHPKLVGNAAIIIANSKNKKADKNILKIAAWAHDLGYIYGKENHAERSLEILQKDFEVSETLKDCIINHGSSAKPQTEEGKIIQLADKACIISPEILKLIMEESQDKIKQEDIDFIKKMSEKLASLMERFEK
jgi:HD superfamily phosphodiesterase